MLLVWVDGEVAPPWWTSFVALLIQGDNLCYRFVHRGGKAAVAAPRWFIKTSYRAAAATRRLIKKSYRAAATTRWLISLPPPRRCHDGFQKNVPNFTAASVLDQKY